MTETRNAPDQESGALGGIGPSINNSSRQNLCRALAAAERGWLIHPVELTADGQKKPLTKWSTSPTTDEAQIRRWWRQWPNAIPGVVTGQKSDLYVVDVDRPERLAEVGLPLTSGIRIPSRRQGGEHYYFAGPVDGRTVKNKADGGLDFRGDGGYVCLWADAPTATLAPLPPEVASWARDGREPGAPAQPMPDRIGEGERESHLISLAGTMRRRGSSEAAILAALRVENEERCEPPLEDESLQRLARSAARYQPADVPRGGALYNALGSGNTNRAARANGVPTEYELSLMAVDHLKERACWRQERKEWWMCSRHSRPGVWSPERQEGVMGEVIELVAPLHPRITAPLVKRVIELAKPNLAVSPSDFDQNPWTLGVIGGVIDLKTGKLEAARPELMLTRCAPVEYQPDALCPTWLAHLDRLLEGEKDRIEWLQMAVGAALVGDAAAKDQVFVYLYGPSGNGKGTMMRGLEAALGENQHLVNINATDLTNRDRHLSWMTRLRGARLVVAEEATKNLNTRKLKTLTGADPITANKMRQDDETWMPTHTIFMTANHPLSLSGGDVIGMRRRYRPLRTGPALPDEEKNQQADWEDRIRAEAPGILAWAVQGCLLWQQRGQRLPQLAVIEKARDADLEDAGRFGEWFSECVDAESGGEFTTRKSIISSVNWWRAQRGLESLREADLRDLYAWLKDKGAQEDRRRVGGIQERGFWLRVRRGILAPIQAA